MDRVKELEELLVKHKHLYYSGRPEISDFEYDKLEDELRSLSPNSRVLRLIGHKVSGAEKVKHDKKMLSLAKTYSIDDLEKWRSSREVVSTYKIDGVSCSLVYSSKKLILAKTRGDGKVGENITAKAMFVTSIPQQVQESEEFEVRGELFCTEEDFLHLSKEMESRKLEKPSNQRNIVAGLLGRKENLDLCKFLTFNAFDLISEAGDLSKETQKIKELKKLGLITPDARLHGEKRTIEKEIQAAQEFMTQGNFLIDGLVFTLNDTSLHEELGETAHHPRYKIAFKFQGDIKSSKIKQIAWQVSRNGVLTPVAEITPIELSGAMVSRVTLHNYGVVEQYKLKSGDTIEIVRSGEVIPKFLSVTSSSEETFTIPEHCPSCGTSPVVDDIRLLCPNGLCPQKQREGILHFMRKIGIEDISSKRLEEMIDKGLVKKASDLYVLKEQDFLKLNKVKEKLAKKMYLSIQKTKDVDLITLLASLGISGGGENKCERIVQSGYNTIEKVLSLKVEELVEIESFAEKSAKEFINSLGEKKLMIKELINQGISIKKPDKNIKNTLKSQKFCITGSLSRKRSEIEDAIKKSGGIVVSSVTKNTNYLVTNDSQSNSSKFKKALELKIPIISEEELFKKIG